MAVGPPGSRVSARQSILLGLRAAMEVGVVAGFAYWGFQASAGLATKTALAVGLPLVVFGFWGMVDFRWAGRLAEPLRLLQELVVSGLAALAWFAAGQRTLGVTLALLSIVYHALVYALGESLLASSTGAAQDDRPTG